MAPLPKIKEKSWKYEPGEAAPIIEVPERAPANDNVGPPANDNVKGGEVAPPSLITATEWQWIDPATIPPRQWIYGRHYIRKYVSVTVSPGGLGKTGKAIVEALSMVTGRELLGETVHERARVWLLNEDPQEELNRRIAAACKHYRIRPDEIAGRLFVDSFRTQEFITAKQTKSESTCPDRCCAGRYRNVAFGGC
jgi:hypothetical protein